MLRRQKLSDTKGEDQSLVVLPYTRGTLSQPGGSPLSYTVFDYGKVTVTGVTIPSKELIERLTAKLGPLTLRRINSVCLAYLPIVVSKDVLDDAGISHRKGWMNFDDLKVSINANGGGLMLIAKSHPDMDLEQQVTESQQRLCQMLGCE